MGKFIQHVENLDRKIAMVETVTICVVVSAMLLLTTSHVLLKLFGQGIMQFEEIARYLVIWVGFLGGAVATYQSRHINIDLFTRFLKGPVGHVITALLAIIAVGIVIVMLKTSISYVGGFYRSGEIAVSFGDPQPWLAIPQWVAAIIMPVGLVLIGWHMVAGALYAIAGVKGPGHRGLDETLAPVVSDKGFPIIDVDSLEATVAGNGGAK